MPSTLTKRCILMFLYCKVGLIWKAKHVSNGIYFCTYCKHLGSLIVPLTILTQLVWCYCSCVLFAVLVLTTTLLNRKLIKCFLLALVCPLCVPMCVSVRTPVHIPSVVAQCIPLGASAQHAVAPTMQY